jgi:hypothetical protein
VDLLASGDIEVLGLLPYSSNYVFLAKVTAEDAETVAIYKPRRGEQPLWDFPPETLADREVAAAVVSDASGWNLVPPTVLRPDAPLGPGSMQLFIPHDPDRHFFVLMEEERYRRIFTEFVAFDVVINNADRKGGHILEDADGRLWGVDHGLSFNIEPKLRTVIWGLAGEELPPNVRAGLERIVAAFDSGDLPARLDGLLTPEEIIETRARAEVLLLKNEYPAPMGPRPTPWPLV